MLYKENKGEDETRRKILLLWALEEALPGTLNEKEVHFKVSELIPERFGPSQTYLEFGPPYFDELVKDALEHEYVIRHGPFRYKITEAGIARARDIETRFLQKVDESAT